MNTVRAIELIADTLEQKGKATAPELAYAHKIANVQIYGIMKKLEAVGAIEKQDVDNGKIYLLKDGKKLQKYIDNLKGAVDTGSKNRGGKKETITKSPEKKEEKKSPAPKTGRDTSKYVFQKQTLPKGRCVLAVVRAHQEKNNLSLSELKEVFPDSVIPRFGILNSLSAVKKLSLDRPRYFMKDSQILKTSDGKSVVVCSQLTTERFEKFLEIAKGLGYKIKRA